MAIRPTSSYWPVPKARGMSVSAAVKAPSMIDKQVRFPIKDPREKAASSTVPTLRPTAEADMGKMKNRLNWIKTEGKAM
jgi:hypothetical protein